MIYKLFHAADPLSLPFLPTVPAASCSLQPSGAPPRSSSGSYPPARHALITGGGNQNISLDAELLFNSLIPAFIPTRPPLVCHTCRGSLFTFFVIFIFMRYVKISSVSHFSAYD